MRIIAAALASFTLLTLGASPAAACSCSPFAAMPLCQRIDAAKVLFVGTALETNEDYSFGIKSGTWYRFSVEEALKGVDPSVKEVIVDPSSGSSCYEEFEVGKRYLVSSDGSLLKDQQVAAISIIGSSRNGDQPRPTGPVVVTGVCSGSRPVEYAKEDLDFIRQYITAPQPGRIVVSVRSHDDEFLWHNSNPPLTGVNVIVTGAGASARALTALDGLFQLSDVAAGKYSVTASLAGYRSNLPTYEIEVPAHGCGIAHIGMFTSSSVSGTAINADGLPAGGISVEVVYADPQYEQVWIEKNSAKTDAHGQFKIIGLPSGDFHVGVHIDSQPDPAEGILPTYAPGISDQGLAQVIHLAPNDEKSVSIRLGKRVGSRRVFVKVELPDGRPAAGAMLYAQTEHGTEYGRTDAAGRGEFLLVEGVAYALQARVFTGSGLVNGKPGRRAWVDGETKLSAGSGPVEIKIIADKSNAQ